MLRNRIAHLFQELDHWNHWQQQMENNFREIALQAASPVQCHLNVWQRPEGGVISLFAPGVKPNEVDLSVKGQVLEVRINRSNFNPEEGTVIHKDEFNHLQFHQSLQFPFELDPAQTSARLKDGMLLIEVKRHPADEPKRIEVLAN